MQSQPSPSIRTSATPTSRRPHNRSWGRLLGLVLAVQFLTVLPVRFAAQEESDCPAEHTAPVEMAPALPWFPVVGAGLGVALAVLDWALGFAFGINVRDVLLLVALAGVTGMLHLDGFIDCCDGLLGQRTLDRRLEILRDSRVGAYGVVGGALLLLAMYAALGALPVAVRPYALVAAPVAGRAAMAAAVVHYPYARSRGAGSGFHARARHSITAIVLAFVCVCITALVVVVGRPKAIGLVTCLVIITSISAVAIWVGWTRWASGKLGGGLTGDTYGALNELVELGVWLMVPVAFHLFRLFI